MANGETYWGADKAELQAKVEAQAKRIEQLESLMQEFCDRIDAGEITIGAYAKFKKALQKGEGQ